MVLLYIIVLSRFTKINNLIHEEEKQEVAKGGGTLEEYVRAWRKASRADEIASHGRAVSFARVHVSKKVYNRKRDRKIEW